MLGLSLAFLGKIVLKKLAQIVEIRKKLQYRPTLMNNLADYRPLFLRLVEKLNLTGTYKLQKTELQDQVR